MLLRERQAWVGWVGDSRCIKGARDCSQIRPHAAASQYRMHPRLGIRAQRRPTVGVREGWCEERVAWETETIDLAHLLPPSSTFAHHRPAFAHLRSPHLASARVPGEPDGTWTAHELSVDHHPDLKEDKRRLERAGAYVSPAEDGEPARVFKGRVTMHGFGRNEATAAASNPRRVTYVTYVTYVTHVTHVMYVTRQQHRTLAADGAPHALGDGTSRAVPSLDLQWPHPTLAHRRPPPPCLHRLTQGWGLRTVARSATTR